MKRRPAAGIRVGRPVEQVRCSAPEFPMKQRPSADSKRRVSGMKRRPAAGTRVGRPVQQVKEEKLIAVLQWMEAHGNRLPNKRKGVGKEEQAHAVFVARMRKKAREQPKLFSDRSKELLALITESAKPDARRMFLPVPDLSSSSSITKLITDFDSPPSKRSKVTRQDRDAS